jgi:hypothetical protein
MSHTTTIIIVIIIIMTFGDDASMSLMWLWWWCVKWMCDHVTHSQSYSSIATRNAVAEDPKH